MVGDRTQKVNTETTIANVLNVFKATKTIVMTDSPLGLSTLQIIVSAQIRLRCFRATDKIRRFSKNIIKRRRYPVTLRLSNICCPVYSKDFESEHRSRRKCNEQ